MACLTTSFVVDFSGLKEGMTLPSSRLSVKSSRFSRRKPLPASSSTLVAHSGFTLAGWGAASSTWSYFCIEWALSPALAVTNPHSAAMVAASVQFLVSHAQMYTMKPGSAFCRCGKKPKAQRTVMSSVDRAIVSTIMLRSCFRFCSAHFASELGMAPAASASVCSRCRGFLKRYQRSTVSRMRQMSVTVCRNAPGSWYAA
mmetsp:Transcript_72125/g.224921  ORF Transcript_72125/g.224921 Transcript_72125/m.224921 type:complete len:200 (-) Transcript_72125:865-1464(-)